MEEYQVILFAIGVSSAFLWGLGRYTLGRVEELDTQFNQVKSELSDISRQIRWLESEIKKRRG